MIRAADGTDAFSESRASRPGKSKAAAAELVGKQVCAECHQENFHLHSQSGHASTFTLTKDPKIKQLFGNKTVDAGDGFGFYRYDITASGLTARAVDMPQPNSVEPKDAADKPKELPLPYALGSGRNAVTLFALVPDPTNGNAIIEHRVSWFHSHGGFGFTPGHTGHVAETPWEHFGQTLRGERMDRCVDCHTTSAQIVGQTIENLVPNINCEKCHGPGSEHVRQARQSANPPPFSVGKNDWDFESELQLCGGCHRVPKDFDVKTLREYSSEMLRLQPIGLVRSECYLESDGKMMCSTCHNPHADAKSKSAASYIQDCRNCHQPDTSDHVVCPVSPEDDCINCHMPPISVEQGMVFHDHWIRVRKDQ